MCKQKHMHSPYDDVRHRKNLGGVKHMKNNKKSTKCVQAEKRKLNGRKKTKKTLLLPLETNVKLDNFVLVSISHTQTHTHIHKQLY